MSDLHDPDAIATKAQRLLERVLLRLGVSRSLAKDARGETARNVLRELVVATRRNDELKRAVRTLGGLVGEAAKHPHVADLLERVQEVALDPTSNALDVDPRSLPLGVHTPVPAAETLSTPPRGHAVVAREVDATLDGAPTVPFAPSKPVQGPWPSGRKR